MIVSPAFVRNIYRARGKRSHNWEHNAVRSVVLCRTGLIDSRTKTSIHNYQYMNMVNYTLLRYYAA